MKISLEWINDYVDIDDIAPETIAEKLTLSTAEVEDITPVKRLLKDVVAAEVVSVRPVVAGKGLVETIVDCGSQKIRTITTAQNIEPGTKVAFAGLGSVLNNKQYVQLREIAGAESRGKLCTPYDLCLGEANDDVVHIPSTVVTGTRLIDLMAEEDTLLEIDNHSLTHRPDLWGHYGFARELSAIFQRPLKPLSLWQEVAKAELEPISIEIKNPENCQVYNGIRLSKVPSSPSPLVVQSRLAGLGQKAINLVVDLTNYVMFETGQPLHAFDGEEVSAIIVDSMKGDSHLVTLDGTKRELIENDLVILDQEQRPIAIAGIMGGINSQVTINTESVVLESANFKGSAVRKTANRLNLVTEASKRFEKQQPPAVSIIALKRLIHLLKVEQPSIAVSSQLSTTGKLMDEERFLEIPLDFFSKRMGTSISMDLVKGKLTALGFKADCKNEIIRVGIPAFRSQADIAIPEDILEEVARLHGFDAIKPVLPGSPMKVVARDSKLTLEREIKLFLVRDAGFQEIQSYNWFNDGILDLLNYDTKGCIRLLNPVSPNASSLRDSHLPNLLSVVQNNSDSYNECNIFECGRVFLNGSEATTLAVVSYKHRSLVDQDQSLLTTKGILETLIRSLGFEPALLKTDTELDSSWSSGNMAVMVEAQKVGRMGGLSPVISKKLAKDGLIAWFELNLDALHTLHRQDKKYEPTSKYPGSWFDFSLLFSDNISFQEIENCLSRYTNNILRKRTYLYKYKGNGIRENMTSYTYRYELGVNDRTLAGEDLEMFHKSLMTFFQNEKIAVR